MKLEILLKSDLCTSSGENYNAWIDTDVIYDDYGFPFIPAKRLKGVIKEAALELVEFGLYEESDYRILFGREGVDSAAFTLDDAYLQGHAEAIRDIHRYLKQHPDQKHVVHPQRVLGLYTYTRTQTAMTKEGTAKENSLRTFRVVNAGETFEAQIHENRCLSEDQKNLLQDAVKMVKHIGNNRTRGLGQVEMTLSQSNSDTDQRQGRDQAASFTVYDHNVIEYQIALHGPVLCKTSDGNQEHTETYIQGSKVLGILASILGQEEYRSLMGYDQENRPELLVSNAYICAGQERCTPIAASWQKKKDQSFDEDGVMAIKDMLSGYQDDEQWTPLGQGYMTEAGVIKSVETQINYHHKRPDNKAVGRATGEDDSSFYQLRSICKDQTFRGFLLADRAQAERIVEKLSGEQTVRIGNSKNTEYGNAVFELVGVSEQKEKEVKGNSLVVKLNAAAILYNAYGMPSAEIDCLSGYLEEALGLSAGTLCLQKCFASYEEIGGFNVTWHRRKPYFTALGKGSVFLYECKEAITKKIPEKIFLGERALEGYGEAVLCDTVCEDVKIRKYQDEQQIENDSDATALTERLERMEWHDKLREKARRAADVCAKKYRGKREFTATMGKLLLLSKTVQDMKEVKEQIEGIESDSKKALARKLFEAVDLCVDEATPEDTFRVMLPEFLTQLKYRLRAEKEGVQHGK